MLFVGELLLKPRFIHCRMTNIANLQAVDLQFVLILEVRAALTPVPKTRLMSRGGRAFAMLLPQGVGAACPSTLEVLILF